MVGGLNANDQRPIVCEIRDEPDQAREDDRDDRAAGADDHREHGDDDDASSTGRYSGGAWMHASAGSSDGATGSPSAALSGRMLTVRHFPNRRPHPHSPSIGGDGEVDLRVAHPALEQIGQRVLLVGRHGAQRRRSSWLWIVVGASASSERPDGVTSISMRRLSADDAVRDTSPRSTSRRTTTETEL